jgi:hypothetical protein
MTRLFARTLTLFILAMLGLVATASAQSMSVIKVNVPFEFNFGDSTFPAGTYTLSSRDSTFSLCATRKDGRFPKCSPKVSNRLGRQIRHS